MAAPQTYKNHARFDPAFHFFLIPVSVLNVGLLLAWHLRHRTVHPELMAWLVFMAVIFLVAVFKIRLYALRNQDRVIRLEEHIRYKALLPSDVLERSAALSLSQIVALRFASDAELSGLVKRTLAEGLNAKSIKQSIQYWRPDNHRV